jgi:estrogen-related receptor beta like 1
MTKTKEIAVTSVTIRSMENTLERLRCLKYKSHISKRISIDEFILPSSNTAFQFNLYIELVKWLISTLRLKDESINSFDVEEYEDPNFIAQKLMLSLRSLNFSMDFPIAKLKQPFGEIVCSILDFLTSKALQSSGFVFQKPMYVDERTNQEGGDEEAVIDDTSFNGGGYDEDDNDNDALATETIDMSYFDDGNDNDSKLDGEYDRDNSTKGHTNTKIQSQIDPIEWKRELERVGPLLDIKFENKHDNWRNQVESVYVERENFGNEFTASKSAFERLCKESSGTLRRMETKESAIHDKFRQIGSEHEDISTKIKRLENNRRQYSADLDDSRKDLLAVTNRLVEVKAKVDEKGSSITDTSQLVNIKTTLQDIKAEIRNFDLEIGILEHTLLHKRLRVLASN